MEDEPQPFEARPTSLDDIDRFALIVGALTIFGLLLIVQPWGGA